MPGSGLGGSGRLRQTSDVLTGLSLTPSLKCSNRLEEFLNCFGWGLFVCLDK